MNTVIILVWQLARYQSNKKSQILYFIKGLVFLPFLLGEMKHDSSLMASSHLHEAGADVYPLF